MNLSIRVNKWQVWFPLKAQTLLPCYVNICPFLPLLDRNIENITIIYKNICPFLSALDRDSENISIIEKMTIK